MKAALSEPEIITRKGKPVSVILPIKGVDDDTQANVHALLSQDYPEYRLIFAVESEDDPVVGGVLPLLLLPLIAVRVPESIRFLALTRDKVAIAKVLARMGVAPELAEQVETGPHAEPLIAALVAGHQPVNRQVIGLVTEERLVVKMPSLHVRNAALTNVLQIAALGAQPPNCHSGRRNAIDFITVELQNGRRIHVYRLRYR